MKNKLEKQLRSFIDFDYSKRTIDRFHRWMISSDSAEEKETALRNLWFKTKGKAEHDMEYSFRQVLDKIGIEYTPMVTDVNRWNLWKSVAAAAVIVVLSVTATLWISYNHFDRDNIAMVEHYVNNGTRETISLPDGTTVHLNSGSHVFYPENLEGKTRTIYLIGEAEFKVARNPKKPFIVRSSNMAITALGTEFNVNAYPDSNELIATLLEGRVKVEFNNLMSNIILKPNEQLVYDKHTKAHNLRMPEIDDVTAWQRGELVFSNMHLEDIFTNLERKFPYAFVYSLHSLKKNTYSFRFSKQANLEEVMKIISQVVGNVNYVVKGNKCYVTSKE